jgi:hypothetical protein
MNRHRIYTAAVSAVVAGITLSVALTAEAIPAFARKYRFSCSTCHAPFPRLKPYGEEFAARGFRLPPGEEPTRSTYDLGDPLLALQRELPLAIRMEGYASSKESFDDNVDVEWPWAFKLLSGGPIADSISYYFYGIMEKGESIKLEDAFLQFNSVMGTGIDVMFGQFQICDTMFKRELRLEREDYQIYKTRIGLLPTDLTYDRGLVLSGTMPGDIDVTFQVVNGNGIEAAEGDNFDSNGFKDTSLHFGRAFGPVSVGLFGYYTNYDRDGVDSTTTYFGPDLALDLGDKWACNLQYLVRSDDRPFFGYGTDLRDVETKGGFVELHFFPQGQDGRWVVSVLYNNIDSDWDEADYESAFVTVNRLVARNLRILLEAGRDIEQDANRVSLGVVTAF